MVLDSGGKWVYYQLMSLIIALSIAIGLCIWAYKWETNKQSRNRRTGRYEKVMTDVRWVRGPDRI